MYRFHNPKTGAHVYTINEVERAHIAAKLPQYVYEGIAFSAQPTPDAFDDKPLALHRFFSRMSDRMSTWLIPLKWRPRGRSPTRLRTRAWLFMWWRVQAASQ